MITADRRQQISHRMETDDGPMTGLLVTFSLLVLFVLGVIFYCFAGGKIMDLRPPTIIEYDTAVRKLPPFSQKKLPPTRGAHSQATNPAAREIFP